MSKPSDLRHQTVSPLIYLPLVTVWSLQHWEAGSLGEGMESSTAVKHTEGAPGGPGVPTNRQVRQPKLKSVDFHVRAKWGNPLCDFCKIQTLSNCKGATWQPFILALTLMKVSCLRKLYEKHYKSKLGLLWKPKRTQWATSEQTVSEIKSMKGSNRTTRKWILLVFPLAPSIK